MLRPIRVILHQYLSVGDARKYKNTSLLSIVLQKSLPIFRTGRRCSIAIAFQFCFRICHQESQNQVGLDLNGTRQLLVYADDINLLGDSVNTIKENSETLLGASRGIGLEINAEETEYMIMFRHPNSGHNRNIRIVNEPFENVAKFIYLGTTLTNQNDIHDEIKSRLNSGN
jgi:hypothetical protein